MPVIKSQVREIIINSPKKSLILSQIPTYLLHKCLDLKILDVTPIINYFVWIGAVLLLFKHDVIISLLLKKQH